jgi:hypothetical protein
MRSRALLAAFLCLVGLLDLSAARLGAAAPPPAPDPRRNYLCDHGTFRRLATGAWLEHDGTARHRYREYRRAPEYIELYDGTRDRYVRLYPFGVYVYVPREEHYRRACAGCWHDSTKRLLDRTRSAPERRLLATADNRRNFPYLGEQYEVLGPNSASYNCIGWSLGRGYGWVWPAEAGTPVSLKDFDALYGYYGWRRVKGLDYDPVPRHDKLVLYALRRTDGRIEPTHASLQMSDGSWSSKLGSLPLIRHYHPRDVAGPTYGAPYVVYVRPVGSAR